MNQFTVTRAHLKLALDKKNWDLLDKLLEIDPTHINDKSLYTDTWGEWWGLLCQAASKGYTDGVRILLKHGADREQTTWGDALYQTPLELAHGRPKIIALLEDPARPTYTRKSEPDLAKLQETPEFQAINRQGEIRDRTGLVFPTDEQKS